MPRWSVIGGRRTGPGSVREPLYMGRDDPTRELGTVFDIAQNRHYFYHLHHSRCRPMVRVAVSLKVIP